MFNSLNAEMSERVAIIVQKRPARAGAQTSLSRLLRVDAFRPLKPVVLCGKEGWLTQYCEKIGVAFFTMDFPSSRSLLGRVWLNRQFAAEVESCCREKKYQPAVVVANDHQECLLAHHIGQEFGAPVVAILRTPGMKLRDYHKYSCGHLDVVFPVGEVLLDRVSRWEHKSVVHLFREGLLDEEFVPPKPVPSAFPQRVLVAGSEVPRKGWAEFLEALCWIEKEESQFPCLQCDFTGVRPEAVPLALLSKHTFHFLGRINTFRDLVRTYDLVIHPSRHESFGLAPLETLAAGVPVLASRTGAVTEVLEGTAFLFEPRNAVSLAKQLVTLWQNWPPKDLDLSQIQQHIRKSYSMYTTAEPFTNILARFFINNS